jgi:CheY-like chemotaxis protein
LSLARTLVELHGGKIEGFSGGLGQGSEFVVRLPLLAASAAPAVAPDVPREAQPGRRLLLVDDSVDAAAALSQLLELLGHEVRTANNGDAALSLVDTFRPEVVILDIGMPGKDGFQLAREMRSRPSTKDALLVALTGYGQAKDRERSRDAGFDHHFVKPVSFNEILDVIDRSFKEPVVRNPPSAE